MAQACHAALESGKEFPVILDEPDSLIVLQVNDQEELHRAADLLHKNAVGLVKFWEPEPRWNYGYTAFATEPMTREQRGILNGYKLWTPRHTNKRRMVKRNEILDHRPGWVGSL